MTDEVIAANEQKLLEDKRKVEQKEKEERAAKLKAAKKPKRKVFNLGQIEQPEE